MSNTFNLRRFWQYFKKHTADYATTYLLSTATLCGVMLLALLIVYFMRSPTDTIGKGPQISIFIFCFWGGGAIFTSLIFSDFSDKRKAIPSLTLPVSNLEKYLVGWLYSYLIFQVIAIASFYLIDAAFMRLIALGTQKANKVANIFEDGTWKFLFTMYTVFHAFLICGSVYFKRLHFIKTVFVFFVGFVVLNLASQKLISWLTGGALVQSVLRSRVIVDAKNWDFALHAGNPILDLGKYVLITLIVLLWFSAFFKLKEKQV